MCEQCSLQTVNPLPIPTTSPFINPVFLYSSMLGVQVLPLHRDLSLTTCIQANEAKRTMVLFKVHKDRNEFEGPM